MSPPVSREFALYHLDGCGAPLPSARAEPFSAALYSRYKYGSLAATEWFGSRLATAFTIRHAWLAHQPRLLLAPSPHGRVPTAAAALTRAFQTSLNTARDQRGLPPAPTVQIERTIATSGDYGTLSTEERRALMAGNGLSFERFRPHGVDGAHLLVVDDVRVTGAHQNCLTRASAALPFASRTFVYIAAFPADAPEGVDPRAEDALNHAAVTTVDDLAGIARSPGFAWNVRVCKFLLGAANRERLTPFLATMTTAFVHALHHHSLADGYATMPAYRDSHRMVQDELRRRPAHRQPQPPQPPRGGIADAIVRAAP